MARSAPMAPCAVVAAGLAAVLLSGAVRTVVVEVADLAFRTGAAEVSTALATG